MKVLRKFFWAVALVMVKSGLLFMVIMAMGNNAAAIPGIYSFLIGLVLLAGLLETKE
jgi:hypothetical protein